MREERARKKKKETSRETDRDMARARERGGRGGVGERVREQEKIATSEGSAGASARRDGLVARGRIEHVRKARWSCRRRDHTVKKNLKFLLGKKSGELKVVFLCFIHQKMRKNRLKASRCRQISCTHLRLNYVT